MRKRASRSNFFELSLLRRGKWKPSLAAHPGRKVRAGYVCFLMLALFSLLAPAVLTAETRVSGFVNTDTEWTLSGSPYIVDGDITVSRGGIDRRAGR